ncbi:MAG: hypothetical protein HC810_06715 [Acaryochloridaceae cyanobacterium RL_2_7]|nr:hypothetical protein [Acaryochloridaceae cyanobacterium RL_2_7]
MSALAGVIPTQSQGLLWFTVLNTQGDVAAFRQQQEQLVNAISNRYGLNPNEPLMRPTLDPKQLKTITEPL